MTLRPIRVQLPLPMSHNLSQNLNANTDNTEPLSGEESLESRDTFAEATAEDISVRRRSWPRCAENPRIRKKSK